jgi:hypothetical protein
MVRFAFVFSGSIGFGSAQAGIPAKETATVTGDRLRGNGRQLIAKIGLIERPADDCERMQTRERGMQRELGRNADQHQVRMSRSGRQQRACNFNARMSGLNGLLRRGEILTNENINVRNKLRVVALRETGHGNSLLIEEKTAAKVAAFFFTLPPSQLPYRAN